MSWVFPKPRWDDSRGLHTLIGGIRRARFSSKSKTPFVAVGVFICWAVVAVESVKKTFFNRGENVFHGLAAEVKQKKAYK